MAKTVRIVGGGLAGVEAAYQLARRGVAVELFEMRPQRMTEAHATGDFGELVCSNSLRSISLTAPAGLLKEEMRRLDSLVIRVAENHRVPAGSALAVDRESFARTLTRFVEALPNVRIHRHEIADIPSGTGDFGYRAVDFAAVVAATGVALGISAPLLLRRDLSHRCSGID